MFKGIFDYCNLGRAQLAFGEWKSGMVLGSSQQRIFWFQGQQC